MPVSPDFSSIFSISYKIDFTQCLPNGRLKYTDLCNLLQLAAAEHAELGGIGFHEMQQHDQAWVMSRMRIEIKTLPRWKDIVTIKTWIVSLENSRSVRAMELYINAEKQIGCESFWAVFNTKKRRPEMLALPHEHFEQFPQHFSTSSRVKKIEVPQSMEKLASRSVVLSDLDIVNHVNNVKYLEWCLDAEDAQLALSGKISCLDMNFMKELVLADTVEILENIQETTSTFTVTKDSKKCFALEITR